MLTLAALREEVAKTIASGRIGRAVAVRLFASFSADHGQLIAAAAAVLNLADRWIDGKLVGLDVRGTVESGHLTVLAEFSMGATALVAVAQQLAETPKLEFLIVGTLGTIGYDAANALAEPVLFDPAVPYPLTTAIERGLREKTTVTP